MKILAIESSCDETSAAVLEKKDSQIEVLSCITATSLSLHAATGGIIPENAAREQVKFIIPVIVESLLKSKTESAGVNYDFNKAHKILENDIDAVAVTFGPGLIGSLLVGVETAKSLAYVFEKPLIPVNHLLAHIYANFINSKTYNLNHNPFPFIGLIVSGGHTDLLLFKQHGEFQWLGGTRDDAAGEAFDKIGRVLGLSYPAGPEIERRANLVKQTEIKFKSSLINEDNFDFSFSGLKTEAMRFFQNQTLSSGTGDMHEELINQVCFATQKAIIDVLIKKTLKAAEQFNCNTIMVGGGVSANQTFRDKLDTDAKGINVMFPEKKYSTDNAAMVGCYALLNPAIKNWEEINANPELYFS